MSDIKPEGFFEIVSVNISDTTGCRKKPVPSARLKLGKGLEGDAHAGIIENRQVSLLAIEEIEAANAKLKAAAIDPSSPRVYRLASLCPGDYAENLTTRGIALHELPLGTLLEIGEALLEVSKIGKECHAACEIWTLVGDCVMPRKGIFARVVREGEVRSADRCHYRFG